MSGGKRKPAVAGRERSARSLLMSRVRQRGTSAELAVRALLRARTIRFRANALRLPGRPDIYVPSHRAALFVHGCFWHRHPNCRASSQPKTNAAFWTEKFRQNIARDRRTARALRQLGLRVLTVWECQTRGNENLSKLSKRFERLFAKATSNAKKKK